MTGNGKQCSVRVFTYGAHWNYIQWPGTEDYVALQVFTCMQHTGTVYSDGKLRTVLQCGYLHVLSTLELYTVTRNRGLCCIAGIYMYVAHWNYKQCRETEDCGYLHIEHTGTIYSDREQRTMLHCGIYMYGAHWNYIQWPGTDDYVALQVFTCM